MNIQHAIGQLLEHRSLSHKEMQSVMQLIMSGECTDAQIGGFLIALRMKGETVDEITAAAEVMASLADKVDINSDHLIDIVGTGGDGASTFNVSTAASFVAAGAGATVAKHGNRSVSSQSGSADCLEIAGANLALNASQVAKVIDSAGVGFMFAPMHHSAMKHAITARKDMAVRTIFNVLGPLTNPAQVAKQVVGVFAKEMTSTIANVLGQLNSQHAMVVHSEDGMDEISICAPTHIAEVTRQASGDYTVTEYTIQPEDFDLQRAHLNDIVVSSPTESFSLIEKVLAGKQNAARDMVVLNAGAGIYVSGVAASLAEGIAKAIESIDSGNALTAKKNYVAATNAVST